MHSGGKPSSSTGMLRRLNSHDELGVKQPVGLGREEAAEGTTNIQFAKSRETEPLLKQPEEASVKKTPSRFSRPCSWNWKNLIVAICLWLTYMFCSVAYSIIAPFFPEEAEQRKGSTPVITGLIISCSPLCVVILSPLFGYFLPHFGSRFMILSGLLLIGGSFILLGFVDMMPSGWVFIFFCILLRMTEGVGTSMFITATFTLLPVLFPKSVGTVTGVFEVGGGLGFAIGPPLGGLLYQLGGFRLPFVSVGGAVLFFIIPCLLLIREKSFMKKHIPMLRMTLNLCTDFSFIVLILANTLALVALSFFNPTLQPFLADHFDLTSWQVGLVFFVGPGIYMVTALFAGPISDSLGPRWFIVGGFFFYGLGYFFIGPADFITAPKLWITCTAFGVIGFAAALGFVPIYPDMLEIAKRQIKSDDEASMTALTAVVSGVVSSSLSFGEFMGPLIGGALTEVLPFTMSAVVFGEVVIAEAVLLLGVTLIDRYTRPRR